jgi:hypothetical protein
MVKLNTGLKLAALVQLAQTETNKFFATARTLPDRVAVLFLNIDCLPLVASAGASGYWMFFGAALQPGHRRLVDPHQMTPNQRLKTEFFSF